MLEKIEKLNPADLSETKPKRKKAKKGSNEPASHEVSINLFRAGLNSDQIAAERQLSSVTIEEHLSRGVAEGKLELSEWISSEQQQQITAASSGLEKPFRLKDVVEALENRFSYGKVRAVLKALGIEYDKSILER